MEIFIVPEVVILLFVESLLLFFHLFILKNAITILRHFDIDQNTPLQYDMEKKGYLAAAAIRIGLLFSFLLLPFLIFILDKLSHYLPGAMCAAGVVGANGFGTPLILVYLFFLLISGFWLVLHHLDNLSETLQFTRLKFGFYLFLFTLFMIKFILFVLYLFLLDPQQTVACCSLLYGSGQFGGEAGVQIPAWMLAAEFAGLLLITLFVTFRRLGTPTLIANLLMLMFSLYAITHLFSPYVYELPTHHCPYCVFQPEYSYVGYPLYTLMLTGGFSAMIAAQMKLMLEREIGFLYRLSLIGWILFAALCAFYPIRYYLVNGVWL